MPPGANLAGRKPADAVTWSGPNPSGIEDAVVQAVAYSDVFDYPLTAQEIYRYLVGVRASLVEVVGALEGRNLVPARLARVAGFYSLPGREEIAEKRLRRAEVSAALWPKAIRYGHAIAGMPFVRMVAVTGALSVDNSEPGDDLDYLIVTEPGRLWLCRAFVIGLVRVVARRGDIICPNYFISTRALVVTERNLYTAREMTQMVPVSGLALYHEMRRVNPWVEEFLPNAAGAPREALVADPGRAVTWAAAESVLRTPPGAWLEQWEMQRKLRRLVREGSASKTPLEADFGPDYCKGHFGGYGWRTLDAMADRMETLSG